MKLELYTEKIDEDLRRMGKTRYWLAKETGRDYQLVYYWLKNKSVAGAEDIARVLKYSNAKDLIK